MKKLFLILFVGILFSCHQKHDASGHVHDHQMEEQFVAVELDDGKKWAANPETTEGVRNMQALIGNAESAGNKELSDALEIEYKEIIQKCTMKGEGHMQLHHYLAPVQHYMQQMKTGDKDEANEALSALKEHIEEFGDYFE